MFPSHQTLQENMSVEYYNKALHRMPILFKKKLTLSYIFTNGKLLPRYKGMNKHTQWPIINYLQNLRQTIISAFHKWTLKHVQICDNLLSEEHASRICILSKIEGSWAMSNYEIDHNKLCSYCMMLIILEIMVLLDFNEKACNH